MSFVKQRVRGAFPCFTKLRRNAGFGKFFALQPAFRGGKRRCAGLACRGKLLSLHVRICSAARHARLLAATYKHQIEVMVGYEGKLAGNVRGAFAAHGFRAALFDFDGVLMDTEGQYTEFWNVVARRFVPCDNFAEKVKGQTLDEICKNYFAGRDGDIKILTELLDQFEHDIDYAYIAGAREFVEQLRSKGVLTAVVTSSNVKKMENVHRTHPEFAGLFDAILTSEDFGRSKPAPDCYIAAMKRFGVEAGHCAVFEDSLHGLASGRASGAFVVGLATTNPRAAIVGKADMVVDDFTQLLP